MAADFSAASTVVQHSSRSNTPGTSCMTCLPAAIAVTLIGQCSSRGVQE